MRISSNAIKNPTIWDSGRNVTVLLPPLTTRLSKIHSHKYLYECISHCLRPSGALVFVCEALKYDSYGKFCSKQCPANRLWFNTRGGIWYNPLIQIGNNSISVGWISMMRRQSRHGINCFWCSRKWIICLIVRCVDVWTWLDMTWDMLCVGRSVVGMMRRLRFE